MQLLQLHQVLLLMLDVLHLKHKKVVQQMVQDVLIKKNAVNMNKIVVMLDQMVIVYMILQNVDLKYVQITYILQHLIVIKY